jgi:hypothetical protein
LDLEPFKLGGDERGLRPTLFLGLGGTAALVLRKLRQRLSERFGGPSAVPCWQMLLVDTDADTLRAAERGAADEALSPDESVFVPLRRAASYRAASDQLLSWLSRRWLYNIPRSLRTEGLRPLGRLAYVDHAQRIAERIRRAVAGITRPEAMSKSAETTGLPFRSEAPRVFVVSSICGGTGGGMLFDVAFAVREILAEFGYPTDDVCGVLTYGTSSHGAANDLRKANAYATLTEWHHYQSAKGLDPGSALAIAPAPAGPPFGESYLIDLGGNLGDAEFDAATASVARYLYLDAATVCGAALDRCRALSRGGAGQAKRLRTFGLHVMACDKYAAAATQAHLLCQRTVGGWHGEGRPVDAGCLHLNTSELNLEALGKRLYAVADKALGGKADVHFRNLLAQTPALASPAERDALMRIDALLGAPQEPAHQGASDLTRLAKSLGEAAAKLAGGVGDSIVHAASGMLEEPGARLPAAMAAAALFQEHLRSLRQEADELFREADADAAALRSKLVRGEGAHGAPWLAFRGGSSAAQGSEKRMLEYCERRLRTLVYKNLVVLVQSAMGAVAAFNERMLRLRPRLEQFGLGFKAGPREPADDEGQTTSYVKVAESAAHSVLIAPAFVRQFDDQLQRELLQPAGGLMALAEMNDEAVKSLREQMQSRSRALALAAMRDVDAARVFVEHHPDATEQAETVAAMAEKALPRLLRYGGAKRLLAVVPDSGCGHTLAASALRDLPAAACTMFDADADVVFCYEAEDLSPAKVAGALIDDRPDCAAAARRVLTRVDVHWALLPSAREPSCQIDPVRQAVTVNVSP